MHKNWVSQVSVETRAGRSSLLPFDLHGIAYYNSSYYSVLQIEFFEKSENFLKIAQWQLASGS